MSGCVNFGQAVGQVSQRHIHGTAHVWLWASMVIIHALHKFQQHSERTFNSWHMCGCGLVCHLSYHRHSIPQHSERTHAPVCSHLLLRIVQGAAHQGWTTPRAHRCSLEEQAPSAQTAQATWWPRLNTQLLPTCSCECNGAVKNELLGESASFCLCILLLSLSKYVLNSATST